MDLFFSLSMLACELATGKSKTWDSSHCGENVKHCHSSWGGFFFLVCFFADGFGVQGTDGLTVSD